MLNRRLHKASSESTLVKMPHCWKSRVAAQLLCCLSAYCSFWINADLFGDQWCKNYCELETITS